MIGDELKVYNTCAPEYSLPDNGCIVGSYLYLSTFNDNYIYKKDLKSEKVDKYIIPVINSNYNHKLFVKILDYKEKLLIIGKNLNNSFEFDGNDFIKIFNNDYSTIDCVSRENYLYLLVSDAEGKYVIVYGINDNEIIKTIKLNNSELAYNKILIDEEFIYVFISKLNKYIKIDIKLYNIEYVSLEEDLVIESPVIAENKLYFLSLLEDRVNLCLIKDDKVEVLYYEMIKKQNTKLDNNLFFANNNLVFYSDDARKMVFYDIENNFVKKWNNIDLEESEFNTDYIDLLVYNNFYILILSKRENIYVFDEYGSLMKKFSLEYSYEEIIEMTKTRIENKMDLLDNEIAFNFALNYYDKSNKINANNPTNGEKIWDYIKNI